MSLPKWNTDFNCAIEVVDRYKAENDTLRHVCRLLFADAFDHDKAAVLAVRWWMRPTTDSLQDLYRHLEQITGVTQAAKRKRAKK